MRYPASEKLEIIRLVERSHLPAKRTLDKLGIPRRTFYRWYDRYQTEGPDGLEDRSPMPLRVWNRIPDDIRERIVKLALGMNLSYHRGSWRYASPILRATLSLRLRSIVYLNPII